MAKFHFYTPQDSKETIESVRSNAYDDVSDFVDCEFTKNTNI